MHFTIIDPHKVQDSNLHCTPLLTTSTDTSTAFMVIDDVTARINPKHRIGMMRKYAVVIDDITAHI
jgi:hypothetical protein